MISGYSLWQYVHIVLFVYWLGADLGVFLASRYVTRSDLPTAERLRFLRLTLQIDLGPRTALILMIPVGVMLASGLGIVALSPGALGALWITALAWLALAWYLALAAKSARLAMLTRIDVALRVSVAATYLALAAKSARLAMLTRIDVALRVSVAATFIGLAVVAPLPFWLAGKFLLFGVAVVLGLLLRRVIGDWAAGFAQLNDATSADAGNARITTASNSATRLALTLWLAVLLIALLGVTKPSWN